MNKQADFMELTAELPVFDTHTHLIGDKLTAGDFWEIAHYFWFFRELQAAGYPEHAMELPESERIEAFLEAYRHTRSTNMNWAFTAIIKDLYGIRIQDAQSVLQADDAVKHARKKSEWAQDIADRMKIKKFVVNYSEHASFQGMREDAVLMPRIDGLLGRWTEEIAESISPWESFEQVRYLVLSLLTRYRELGCPGIMTTLPRLNASANQVTGFQTGASKDEIRVALLHVICEAASLTGMLVQLFLGVERNWCGAAFPANDTERILKLTGLFERYSCSFELVVASELNNLDVVQAAWNFPNVHIGGHWWFNFRASTFRDSMQYRLEALPALKSSLVVSDARCMEWSYGKVKLIKRLTGEFLWKQIQEEWMDTELALQTAEYWLYRSAALRYGNRRPSAKS